MFVLSEIARKSYGQFSLSFETSVTSSENKSAVPSDSPAVVEPAALPTVLDWLFNPDKKAVASPEARTPDLGEVSPDSAFDRILSRLVRAEAHESNPHFRDDYRIAWLTIRFCQTGEAVLCTPQVLATYRVLGCHPDHVWPGIVANHEALLGEPALISARKQTQKTEPAGTDAALPPIKKSVPVTHSKEKRA